MTGDEPAHTVDSHQAAALDPALPPKDFAPRMAAVAVAVVVADQLTKHWAVTSLAASGPRDVFWTLRWNLSFNSGMAFSQGQGLGPVIGGVALAVIIYMASTIRRMASPFAALAGGLIIGGAVGNLIDRLFRERGWLRGRVVDFIDFQWFPIFNIADSAITVGGVLFVVWSLTRGGRQAASGSP
jgi:signal peptidase II